MGNKPKRVPELDGLRGLAVLGVIAWHCFGWPLPPVGFPVHGDQSVIAVTKWTLSMLRSGVDLFFVLSGYLIGGILMDNRESPRMLRVFYARRAFRILPPYLLLLGLFAMARSLGGKGALFDGPIPLFTYFLFVQNYVMVHFVTSGPLLIGVTWSLAVEEQFYAVFPLLVRAFCRSHLVVILLAGIAAAPALRVWTYFHYGGYNYPSDAWAPCRMDALFLGALLAWAERSDPVRSWIRRRLPCMKLVFLGLVLAVAAFCRIAASTDYDRCWALYGQSLFGVLYAVALLLIIMQAGGKGTAWLRSRFLCQVGRISYGLYLWHMAFFLGVFALLGRPLGLQGMTDAVIIVGALVLALAFCRLSFDRIEHPLLRVGQRFQY